MPYAFRQIEPSLIGEVSRWDVPLNEWMGTKFGQGVHDTFFGSLQRRTEDAIWDDGNELRPDVATKVWGIPGFLKFDKPISIQRARLIRERKEEELRRLSVLNAAIHSPFGLKAATGTLAGMIGSVSNPLDAAAMFIPFVGSSARATGVAKMGGNALEQVMARGFFTTEEALATRIPFPAFGAAVINGTFGNAALEIPVFIQNVRDQAVYGPADAALNIALGGATGGLFHVAGKALGKVLGLSAQSHSRLSPETQELAARQAMTDTLDQRGISSDRVALADRDAIRRDIIFDEASARARALEEIGVLPEEAQARAILETVNMRRASALDLLDLARAEANRGGIQGQIAARLVQRFKQGERGPDLFQQIADLFEVRYDPLAPTVQENLKAGLLFGPDEQLSKSASASLKKARTELRRIEQVTSDLLRRLEETPEGDPMRRVLSSNVQNLQRQRNDIVADMEKATALIQEASHPLTPDEISAHADAVGIDDLELQAKAAELEARADDVREQRIQAILSAERSRHAASVEDQIDPIYHQRLKDEIREGRMLTDEQIKDLTKDPTGDGLAVIRDQLATLEKDAGEVEIKEMPDIKKAFDVASKCLLGVVE